MEFVIKENKTNNIVSSAKTIEELSDWLSYF